jgi:hypothetical protein
MEIGFVLSGPWAGRIRHNSSSTQHLLLPIAPAKLALFRTLASVPIGKLALFVQLFPPAAPATMPALAQLRR